MKADSKAWTSDSLHSSSMDVCLQKELLAICRDLYMLQMHAEALGLSQKKKKTLLHLEDYFWLVSNQNKSILRGERSARRWNRSSIRHGVLVKDTKEGQSALTTRQATLTAGPSWLLVIHLC